MPALFFLKSIQRALVVAEIIRSAAFEIADIIELEAVDIAVFKNIAVIGKQEFTHLLVGGVEHHVTERGCFVAVARNREPFRLFLADAQISVGACLVAAIKNRQPEVKFHPALVAGFEVCRKHVESVELRVLGKKTALRHRQDKRAVVYRFDTERVYTVPGVGNTLTNAITAHDNAVIVGISLFYSILSIVSIILGDILMALVDPRISFSTKGR